VRDRAAGPCTAREKLAFAFERWAIHPFELTQGSPDARDLLQCDLPFTRDLKARWTADFEAILAGILSDRPDAARIAKVLAASVHGFKLSAGSVEELRSMVEAMLDLVAA